MGKFYKISFIGFLIMLPVLSYNFYRNNESTINDYKNLIGNWYSCDVNFGYFEVYIEDDSTIQFYDYMAGTASRFYTIKNDSMIFPYNTPYESYLIITPNPDTLILKNERDSVLYVRIKDKINLQDLNSYELKANNLFFKNFKERSVKYCDSLKFKAFENILKF